MNINSKTSSDELFVLIKSLSKAEKRFFKLNSSRYQKKSGSNYIKLFDCIDNQKVYNEERIIKRFKGSVFSKRPEAAKHHLYELILQSLESSKGKNDKNPKYLFNKAKVLFEKGLYQQCQKAAIKARRRALEVEDIMTVLEITTLERRIIQTSLLFASSEKQLDILAAIEKQSAQKLDEVRRVRELERIVFRYYYKYRTIQDKKVKTQYEKEVEGLLKIDTNVLKSIYAKWLVCNAIGIYYTTIGNIPKAQAQLLKSIGIIESNEAWKLYQPGITVASLNNYTAISFLLKDYDESLKYINKIYELQTVFPGNKDLENATFSQYNLMLHIYQKKYDYENAIKLIGQVEMKYGKGKFVSPLSKMHFDTNAACIFLVSGQFSEAMKRVALALNSAEATDKYFFTSYARIIQLVILMEVGDYELLRYRTRSLYRHMLKRGTLPPFEKTLLDFIEGAGRNVNIQDRKQLQNSLIELKTKLEKIRAAGSEESNAFDYFDFLSWVESKIQRRPFIDIVKEKAIK